MPRAQDSDFPPVTPETRFEVHSFVVQREADRPAIVAFPEQNIFLEISEEALTALMRLQAGATVQEAEEDLKRRMGCDVDVAAFAQTMLGRGAFATVDGYELPPSPLPAHGVLRRVPSWASRWLVSRWTLVAVLAMVALWIETMLLRPALRPRSLDLILPTHHLAFNIAMIFGGLLGMAYLHELAHYFVARAYGLSPTIRFSHRFYLVILKTDVTGAWLLGRRKAFAIFMAGILFNLGLASSAGVLLFANQMGFPAVVPDYALRFIVMINWLPLTYQLFLFARTDLYYVIMFALRERNLQRDGMRALTLYISRGACLLVGKAVTCGTCGSKIGAKDPLCLGCGNVQKGREDDAMFLTPPRMPRLAIAGALQMAGATLGGILLVRYAAPSMLFTFYSAIVLAYLEIIHHDPLGYSEAVAAILLTGLNAAFVVVFALKSILRVAMVLLLPVYRPVVRYVLRNASLSTLSRLEKVTRDELARSLPMRGLAPRTTEATA